MYVNLRLVGMVHFVRYFALIVGSLLDVYSIFVVLGFNWCYNIQRWRFVSVMSNKYKYLVNFTAPEYECHTLVIHKHVEYLS